jgi:dipicolinate synthase subunit B
LRHAPQQSCKNQLRHYRHGGNNVGKGAFKNGKPLLIAISTNDGLSNNAKNIGHLMNAKNIFFVPFRQDDPIKKCTSLVADFSLLLPAAEAALEGKQLQPVLIN